MGSLTKKIADELNMSHVFQNTNCGTSILGWGLPTNLDMGISILVRPPLQIRKIIGLKLSGPVGFCHPLISFQYAEFRYALFALIQHPKHGPFLVANTHFHHGVEWSPKVREQIKTWEEQKTLTSSERTELESVIENSNLRRKTELKNLFSQLNKLQKKYNNPPVVLAGDMNATVHSPIYREIVESYQMKDSMKAHSPLPYTWNPVANKQNNEHTQNFGFTVPTFGKKELETFFKDYDRQSRRIDYVFVSKNIQVLSSTLFGDQPNAKGIIGSDHFGISLEIQITKPHFAEASQRARH